MDAGWLMTEDQYYQGIYSPKHCVKCIFDTVLKALNDNNKRTFVISDIFFFQKWYKQISEIERLELKKLVKAVRIEFANGGWVMHDEATTNYNQILDQMRLGLEFLLKEFKIKPKVAWQLDPFGHSNTNVINIFITQIILTSYQIKLNLLIFIGLLNVKIRIRRSCFSKNRL